MTVGLLGNPPSRGPGVDADLVGWGRADLPPQAGIAVHVRGDGGRLAAVRIYDDVDPPVS